MRPWHIALVIPLSPMSPVQSQSPAASLTATLRMLDANFVCPERLPSDAARRAELASFGRTLAAKRLSYAQAVKVRMNFLERHGCGYEQAATDASSGAIASSPETVNTDEASAVSRETAAAVPAPAVTTLVATSDTPGIR